MENPTSYVQIAQRLPERYRLPMLELVDAMEKNLHNQLAVRRQDFDELQGMVRDLVQAQQRTEQRVGRLEAAVTELAEAQKRTEQRIEELVQAQIRTEETVRLLADRQNRMLGDILESRYARRAAGYFGRMLRRIRLVLPGSLDPTTEDTLEARLTHEELLDVLQLDVVVAGRLHQPPTPEEAEVWLAAEVSAVIDRGDIEHAQRRAALLRKAGYRTIPVVAGEGLTQGATELLQEAPVVLVLDGRSQGWEEALAAL